MFEEEINSSPFLVTKRSLFHFVILMMISLTTLALAYSCMFDKQFFFKFIGYCSLGILLEISYLFITEGKLRLKSGSSAITAAILVLSIPPATPFWPIFFALVIAIFIVRLPVSKYGIIFNPVLIGRLFLMMAYNNHIVNFTALKPVDSLSSATPLELYHGEGFPLEIFNLITTNITSIWEDIYQIVPGAPGEVFPLLIILIATLLVIKKVADWKAGLFFLLSFSTTNFFINEPVLFNLFSGGVIFASVFIASDPKSTPSSKEGRIIAGVIAGIANALIRKYTFYSEGIVFSFLLVNLLAPLLDRLAFTFRGFILLKRRKT